MTNPETQDTPLAVSLEYTPLSEVDKIRDELRAGFKSGVLKPIEYRKYQLLQLAYLIRDNEQAFKDALKHDLGRPELESTLLEIGPSISEIMGAHKNVSTWAKSESPAFSLNWFAMKPVIRKEPKGVVLIISPFNYPVWLIVSPLAGAIAAGNSVALKLSEQSPAVAELWTKLIPKYLDPNLVRVINGAIPETTRVLELQWDHILYTGSGRVGKIVSIAAARHLTPVSLELGGKSPVIIDPKCDLELAARRILWGKVTNAGQTCVAPDYVLVPRSFQDKFIEALTAAHKNFFPEGHSPEDPGNMSRIVNGASFTRVTGLLAQTKGTIVFGGETNETDRFIPLTVVKDVKADDSLMSEEIFGPILPVVPLDSDDVDEAISFINARDHPLALYIFSPDAELKSQVYDQTQSGAAIANETGIHPAASGVPFGGIGPSGSGNHTGKYSFDMFTHLRGSIDSPGWLDTLVLGPRYPPYTKAKSEAIAKLFSTKLPARPTGPPPAAVRK